MIDANEARRSEPPLREVWNLYCTTRALECMFNLGVVVSWNYGVPSREAGEYSTGGSSGG